MEPWLGVGMQDGSAKESIRKVMSKAVFSLACLGGFLFPPLSTDRMRSQKRGKLQSAAGNPIAPSPPLGADFRLLWNMVGNLPQRRRFQIFCLLGVMLVSGLLEFCALGSFLPVFELLTHEQDGLEHPNFKIFRQIWGWIPAVCLHGEPSPRLVVSAFALLFVFSSLFRVGTVWFSAKLSNAVGSDLGFQLFRKALYQPYQEHLSENTSILISGITQQVAHAVFAISSLLTLILSAVLASAILFAMLLGTPWLTGVVFGLLGGAYMGLVVLWRPFLQHNSRIIAKKQADLLKILQEGLGGIRDVLVDGSQEVFGNYYRKVDLPLRIARVGNTMMIQSPRFLLEGLAVPLLAVCAAWMMGASGNVLETVSLLALLVLGAQRLFPAMQQGFAAWAGIAAVRASLEDLNRRLAKPIRASAGKKISRLAWEQKLELHNVSFRYHKEGPWVLRKINLTLTRGENVGLFGKSGAGKSTLLDLVMGLLPPTQGEVWVDGTRLNEAHTLAWQKNISHVPQSIFLADASFAENIAFGSPAGKIDWKRLRQSAAMAEIDGFIRKSARGYGTEVGERGVRISGGQRQRLGIARALYRRKPFLILDEATSALDLETENRILKRIAGLAPGVTVLMVTHRIGSLKNFSKKYEMRKNATCVEIRHGNPSLEAREANLEE